MINWVALIIFIVLCELVGIAGSFFTVKAIPVWYAKLKKPSFSPPNWLFGPVWTVLYLLMGISGYLLWESGPVAYYPLMFFFIQLVLNAVWTPLFFGAKQLLWSWLEINLMWIFILLTIIFAWQVNLWAAILLLPYILWVSFASLLNLRIWSLNKKI